MGAPQSDHQSEQAPDAFHAGIREFNHRRFFEAHEAWEAIWLRSSEPDKTFLQGIIQIAAAFHHHSRGNRGGACSLLLAGLRRVQPFPGSYFGIDLQSLRDQASAWATMLTSGSPDSHTLSLPQIKLVPKRH